MALAVSLRVTQSEHVQAVQLLNDLPTAVVDGAVVVELGGFLAGETSKLVLRLRVPGMGTLGLAQVATLELVHVALPELVQHTTTLDVHVNVVPGDAAAGRVPEPTVHHEALLQTAQAAKRRSAYLLRRGEVHDAVHTLRNAAAQLDSVPELADEVQVLGAMAEQARAGHIERTAKTAVADSSRKSRCRGRGTI